MEQPELLVLDEPTNALDTEGIQRLKEIVRKEKDRGALVILSCHDTVLLEELADEIYYLENGKLVESKNRGNKM